MSDKLKQIQGIRALAILGIFIAHTSLWLGDDLGWFAPLPERLGGSGVVTFLMLSGFLLSYKGKHVPTLDIRALIRSAWGKVSKMYGLYLITILLFVAMNVQSTIKGWIQMLLSLPFHLTLTQNFVPIDWLTQSFNGPAWFLSALFGVWIIVYICHNSINKLMTLSAGKCVVAILVILITQITWLLLVNNTLLPILSKNHCLMWGYKWLRYGNPVLCFSEFCVGILLGRICVCKQFPVYVQNIYTLIAFCFVTLFMAMISMGVLFWNSWIVIIECIVFVGIIAVMSPDSIGYKILAMPPLVWFGDISAYVFLLHAPAILCVVATCEKYLPKPWPFIAMLILCIVFSICADYYYKWRKMKLNNVKRQCQNL